MSVLAPEQNQQLQLPQEIINPQPERGNYEQTQLNLGRAALENLEIGKDGVPIFRYSKGELFNPKNTEVFYIEDAGSWDKAAQNRLRLNGTQIPKPTPDLVPKPVEEKLIVPKSPNKIAFHGLAAVFADKLAKRSGELAESFERDPKPTPKLKTKINKQLDRQAKWQFKAQEHRATQSELREDTTEVKQSQVM